MRKFRPFASRWWRFVTIGLAGLMIVSAIAGVGVVVEAYPVYGTGESLITYFLVGFLASFVIGALPTFCLAVPALRLSLTSENVPKWACVAAAAIAGTPGFFATFTFGLTTVSAGTGLMVTMFVLDTIWQSRQMK